MKRIAKISILVFVVAACVGCSQSVPPEDSMAKQLAPAFGKGTG